MNLEHITLSICDLCREIGHFIQEQSNLLTKEQIQVKGLHDVVSYVDITSEKMIMEKLRDLVPEAGFIAEESGEKKAEKLNWIIDPLDGTTNFIHRLPIYSISIALVDKDEVILGVVYEINRDECFYSWQGAKAYLNGQEIHVSEENSLDKSLLATGFPYRDFSKLKGYISVLESLMKQAQGIRRCGSAAVDLAFVAAGRFEAFFEYALHPWDVAAGLFLVRQAGGVVSTWNGNANALDGKEIVAGNVSIHKTILNMLFMKFYPTQYVGMTGFSITTLDPKGKVIINNQVFDALSVTGYLEEEEPIKVVSYRLGKMMVDKI